jgi:hypothetical protein
MTAVSLDSSPSLTSESPAPNEIRNEERFLFFANVGRLTTVSDSRVSRDSLIMSDIRVDSYDS